MDFELSGRQRHFRDRVRAFMDANVRPRMRAWEQEVASGDRWASLVLIDSLKQQARAEGLWNLFMPPAHGGMTDDGSFPFEGEQLTNEIGRAHV